MSFDFDGGNQGGEGPWIAWTARGTQDGAVPAKSFYLRDGEGKTALDKFQTGVVMDIHNMKTGWQQSDGVLGQAPTWKWNATVAQMMPQPAGDWKKGFSIPCAISKDAKAVWEQAGVAAWGAFVDLVPALQQGPEGKLPVVRLTGSKLLQFKRGSTVQPILEVVKWVDRPDCLKEGFAAGVATEPAPKPAPQPAPAPAAVPEDAEF